MADRAVIDLQKQRAAMARVGTPTRRSVPAQGADRAGRACKLFGVQFPHDMADRLRAEAIREGVSFGEAVRRCCARGLARETNDTATGTLADR